MTLQANVETIATLPRVLADMNYLVPMAERPRNYTFESAGMAVRFVQTRDGHTWENWRDSLRDALSWVYPGPQKLVYE